MSTGKSILEAAAYQPESVRTGKVEQVTSEQLLGARGELIIVHQQREYRLRVTQNGKLILTA